MIRRRLAAYTLIYAAGISAGYFMSEKCRPMIAACFLMSLGVSICLLGISKERSRLIAAMLLGFIIFTASYANYEGQARDLSEAEGGRINVCGRILSAQKREGYTRFVIKTREGIRLMADSGSDDIEIAESTGSIVRVSGRMKEIEAADNPGCFDYRIYMRSKGISFRVKADVIETVGEGDEVYWRLRRYLISVRESFLSSFDEDSSGFIRGLVFGDKSEINEEVQREFNLNSTGHILAVSGLHIGFLYSLLRLLSGRDKTLPATLVIISIMLIYGEMTEWSASTLRAVTVLGLSLVSVNVRRSFDLLSSLSAAALLILIARPYMLFNSGFQMSFAAMGGIAFLGKHLSGIFGRTIGTTLSVQIGTIPIIATTFYRVNLIAALINIPIIMLSSLLVPMCIFLLFIKMLTGFLPASAVSLIQFLCESLISVNHSLAFDGFFSNLTPGAGASFVVIIYIALIFLSSEWLRVKLIRRNYRDIGKLIILAIIPVILIVAALFDPFRNDEIVFIAVGQGDSVHIRCRGNDVLIDGGGSDFTNTGERILMPYLLSQGAADLDLAVLTHLHKDHYLGISELSEQYCVRSVGLPSDYRESFERSESASSSKKASKEANDTISFNTDQIIYLDSNSDIRISDDVYIEVLWPLGSHHASLDISDPNEHNMVYMIHYADVKIMVTGDLLEEDEMKMLKHYRGSDKLKCDILKVAHHGSKSSSSEAFLDAADPKIAVIQVGRSNLYGHPHTQTLERLEARDIEVYRTDIDGAVGVNILNKGARIKIHTFARFEHERG